MLKIIVSQKVIEDIEEFTNTVFDKEMLKEGLLKDHAYYIENNLKWADKYGGYYKNFDTISLCDMAQILTGKYEIKEESI